MHVSDKTAGVHNKIRDVRTNTHVCRTKITVMPQATHARPTARQPTLTKDRTVETHGCTYLREILLQISDLLVVQGPRHELQGQLLECVRVSEVDQVRQGSLRELVPPTGGVIVVRVEPGVMLCLRSITSIGRTSWFTI